MTIFGIEMFSKSWFISLSAQAGIKYWFATRFCFRPFLFDTFVNDHFFLVEDAEIHNYTYGMTTYVCNHELENIVSKLESDPEKVSKWFCDIDMKLNAEKYHILIFGEQITNISVHINATSITDSAEEKLLGVMLDRNRNTLC